LIGGTDFYSMALEAQQEDEHASSSRQKDKPSALVGFAPRDCQAAPAGRGDLHVRRKIKGEGHLGADPRDPGREVAGLLGKVLSDFAHRHRDFTQVLNHNFQLVVHHLDHGVRLSEERRLLIGAYFTHEYSIEGAALFNPSMVPARTRAVSPPVSSASL
jgi:hypothetical protein